MFGCDEEGRFKQRTNQVRGFSSPFNTELEPGVGYGAFSDQDDTKWIVQAGWMPVVQMAGIEKVLTPTFNKSLGLRPKNLKQDMIFNSIGGN